MVFLAISCQSPSPVEGLQPKQVFLVITNTKMMIRELAWIGFKTIKAYTSVSNAELIIGWNVAILFSSSCCRGELLTELSCRS